MHILNCAPLSRMFIFGFVDWLIVICSIDKCATCFFDAIAKVHLISGI